MFSSPLLFLAYNSTTFDNLTFAICILASISSSSSGGMQTRLLNGKSVALWRLRSKSFSSLEKNSLQVEVEGEVVDDDEGEVEGEVEVVDEAEGEVEVVDEAEGEVEGEVEGEIADDVDVLGVVDGEVVLVSSLFLAFCGLLVFSNVLFNLNLVNAFSTSALQSNALIFLKTANLGGNLIDSCSH
jgi:hypothetical protein